MDRILQNVPANLEATLFSGSTASDPLPDSATIQVTKADGTDLLAPLSSTTGTGTGVFQRSLTPTQTATLDVLTSRWTMTVGTSMSLLTQTEIVGGFLCSLSALKESFPDATDAELSAVRTAAEQRIEGACHQAFVPRLVVEKRTARARFRLSWPHVRLIRFASIDGVALTSAQLAALSVTSTGELWGLPMASTLGLSIVRVGYEHGLDYPSEDIREAVTLAAEETFTNTGDGRVIRREADNQSVSYAAPSSSSTFTNTVLRAIVRDNKVIQVL